MKRKEVHVNTREVLCVRYGVQYVVQYVVLHSVCYCAICTAAQAVDGSGVSRQFGDLRALQVAPVECGRTPINPSTQQAFAFRRTQ